MWLVYDIVADGISAAVAGGLPLLFFLTLWVVYPLAGHRGPPSTRSWQD